MRFWDSSAVVPLLQPVTVVRTTAIRLLRVHPLRTADALQPGAAIAAAEDHPATLALVFA